MRSPLAWTFLMGRFFEGRSRKLTWLERLHQLGSIHCQHFLLTPANTFLCFQGNLLSTRPESDNRPDIADCLNSVLAGTLRHYKRLWCCFNYSSEMNRLNYDSRQLECPEIDGGQWSGCERGRRIQSVLWCLPLGHLFAPLRQTSSTWSRTSCHDLINNWIIIIVAGDMENLEHHGNNNNNNNNNNIFWQQQREYWWHGITWNIMPTTKTPM